MNAENLRVGNYVKANGFISEVVAITRDEVECIKVRKEDDEIVTLKLTDIQFEPIPLDKHLLKTCCGFDEGNRIVANNVYLQYTERNNKYVILENDKREALIHFWDVKSLHQLQNLYFALAGVEMAIALCCLVQIIA